MGWCWLWAWLGCDWAERIAREGQNNSLHYSMALLGTSLMQAFKLLLEARVGPNSGHPHSTPPPPGLSGSPYSALSHPHSATRQSWQGQEAAPDLAAQWSPMSAHLSSPPGDFHLALPHWDNSVQKMVIRKRRSAAHSGVTRLGRTDPHTPVEGRPASSFVVCF